MGLASMPVAGTAEVHSFPYCPVCTGTYSQVAAGTSLCLADGRCNCDTYKTGLDCATYKPGLTLQSALASTASATDIQLGGEQYARSILFDAASASGYAYVLARDFFYRDAVLQVAISSDPASRPTSGHPGALAITGVTAGSTVDDPPWLGTQGLLCEALTAAQKAVPMTGTCVLVAATSAMWYAPGTTSLMPGCDTVSSGACVWPTAAKLEAKLGHPMGIPDAWVSCGFFSVFRALALVSTPTVASAPLIPNGGVWVPQNLWRYKYTAATATWGYEYKWQVFFIPKLSGQTGALDPATRYSIPSALSGYLQAMVANPYTGRQGPFCTPFAPSG